MQPYRDIAMLAGTQVLCFLVLVQFEPRYVVIHLYQSILYLAILILLYDREDRWAYMIAMLASGVWLGLAYLSLILSTAVHRLVAFRTADTTEVVVSLVAVTTAVIALLMIALCARHWRKEYAGLGKTLNTFVISLGIVVGVLRRSPALVLGHDCRRLRNPTATSDAGSKRVSYVKFAQHRAFLFMMRPHAPQDVVEDSHGGYDVGPLVEHDALGTLTHSGIGDFRS